MRSLFKTLTRTLVPYRLFLFIKTKKNNLKALPPPLGMLSNEKGTALVLALLLGLIGLVMVISVMYMTGTATWMSGSKKRYQTSLTSAYGGMDFFIKEIIPRGMGGTDLGSMGSYGTLLTTSGTGFTSNSNFTNKLTTSDPSGGITRDYTGANATGIDARFTLALDGPDMIVDTTISKTTLGNSGITNNMLLGGGVVNSNNGVVIPQHIPYLFQSDISSSYEATAAINESATLSSLYAY